MRVPDGGPRCASRLSRGPCRFPRSRLCGTPRGASLAVPPPVLTPSPPSCHSQASPGLRSGALTGGPGRDARAWHRRDDPLGKAGGPASHPRASPRDTASLPSTLTRHPMTPGLSGLVGQRGWARQGETCPSHSALTGHVPRGYPIVSRAPTAGGARGKRGLGSRRKGSHAPPSTGPNALPPPQLPLSPGPSVPTDQTGSPPLAR